MRLIALFEPTMTGGKGRFPLTLCEPSRSPSLPAS